MNIAEWLSGSLSQDQRVREECSRNLEAAYNQNFTQYIGHLTHELVNSAGDQHVRQSAGLALKNALSATGEARKAERFQKWTSVEAPLRTQIKQAILANLDSPLGAQTAQVVSAIAALDLPRNEWPEMMTSLLTNMTNPAASEQLKAFSMMSIGYVCEVIEPAVLEAQSDSILTAVINGARKDEPSNRVRKQALDALYNGLQFVKTNFARDNERNIIMQVVCEATQANDIDTQVSAYQCLIRIADLYYRYMELYMKRALYGVTIFSMQSENEQVVLQSIEFWSTLCEREYDIQVAEEEAFHMATEPEERCMHFAKEVLKELVPVLFWLLTKQDEDADEDEWNPAMAAATCLGLLSQTVGAEIVPFALPLIEQNLRSMDWRHREAAVMTFGSILEGPDPTQLSQLVMQALPFLLETMQDANSQVKDTAAWTLGRICEFVIRDLPGSNVDTEIVQALISGLNDQPRVISSCCWALMNFAEQKAAVEPDESSCALSPFFQSVAQALMGTGARDDNLHHLRTSAYEALSAWVTGSAADSVPIVGEVADEVLARLGLCLNQPVFTPPVAELVSNLCSVLCAVVRRLEKRMSAVQTDRIMETLLRIVSVGATAQATPVLEDALVGIGAMASSIEVDMVRFMPAVVPALVGALNRPEEHALCTVAVGVVSDLARALDAEFAQFSDGFMEILGNLLTNGALQKEIKPPIIMCFGDIALAIGGGFEKYVSPVMNVLNQAGNAADSMTDLEFVEQLRESIVEALVGIVQALSSSDQQAQQLRPWMQFIAAIMYASVKDNTMVEHHCRNVAGLMGDLAIVLRNDAGEYLSQEWVEKFLTLTIKSRLFTAKTRDTARWARDQIRGLAG